MHVHVRVGVLGHLTVLGLRRVAHELGVLGHLVRVVEGLVLVYLVVVVHPLIAWVGVARVAPTVWLAHAAIETTSVAAH